MSETEEKRKKHAEYQRAWRAANPEKAKAIAKRSRERYRTDPEAAKIRRDWIKASKKKPNIIRSRKASKKKRYEKTQYAINHHRRWSDAEIQIAFDRYLTDTEISSAIGRSVQAVESARVRYKDRAPPDWTPKV